MFTKQPLLLQKLIKPQQQELLLQRILTAQLRRVQEQALLHLQNNKSIFATSITFIKKPFQGFTPFV
jgi:hypothetical protein